MWKVNKKAANNVEKILKMHNKVEIQKACGNAAGFLYANIPFVLTKLSGSCLVANLFPQIPRMGFSALFISSKHNSPCTQNLGVAYDFLCRNGGDNRLCVLLWC